MNFSRDNMENKIMIERFLKFCDKSKKMLIMIKYIDLYISLLLNDRCKGIYQDNINSSK